MVSSFIMINSVIIMILLHVITSDGVSEVHERSGLTKVCLVDNDTKIAETVNVANKEKCFRSCEMTRGCMYWTWYKRHCDK